MKKLLCIMFMFFACLAPVHADETQVTLTYTVPESYTLSVPASVGVNDTASFNVTIANATIPSGTMLSVSANSSNYSSGWRMKNGSSYQSYTLKNGSTDIIPNGSIVTLPAGDPSTSASATLTATMQGIPTLAGTYSDSLTFTATCLNPVPVGGIIYYDNGDNGAAYTFFDADNNIITGDVVGNTNVKYYSVSGSPSEYRYLVYAANSDGSILKSDTGKYWTYYDGSDWKMESTVPEENQF